MANSRHAIAEQLLDQQLKVEPLLLKIDELKEKLRAISIETGDSFTEEVAGKGTVEVKKGREAEHKGEQPVLNVKAFLALKSSEKDRLQERELVSIVPIVSKASKPTVTVRL